MFSSQAHTEEAAGNGWRGRFSVRAFLQGLVFVCGLYVLAFAWAAIRAHHTIEDIERRIPAHTVTVMEIGKGGPKPAAQGTSAGTGTASAAQEAPSADALPPAPIDGLSMTLPGNGKIPVIRKQDGLTSFDAYRRPFDRQALSKPVISLAIVGLGLSGAATESAIRTMPPEVSLALSPYAATPDLWVTEARARGHEVWMMLPLEAAKYPAIDPGPHTLLVGIPSSENDIKINWLMSRTLGYVGFIAETAHSPFMKSEHDLRPVINSIYGHGLGFADINADTGAPAETIALGLKAPYANIDLVVDDAPGKEAIAAQLAQLEAIARTQKSAIGIIHPLPVSYQTVLEWVKTLPDKGFVLAPLSAHAGY